MYRGSVLLVGLGGSGRRSAIKLAASMIDAELFQIDVANNYDFVQWRQDIRKVLMHAGVQAKFTVFMFWDKQAVDEAFIDDISTILTAGDLPNLFPPDEKAIILEAMHNVAKQDELKVDMTPLSLYGLFTERVREHLHFALAFSPIGDLFKRRLQIYPSLVNCCTMDWFTEWPNDALQHVARKFIVSMNLSIKNGGEVGSDPVDGKTGEAAAAEEDENDNANNVELSELESNLVDIVIYFNQSVRAASRR